MYWRALRWVLLGGAVVALALTVLARPASSTLDRLYADVTARRAVDVRLVTDEQQVEWTSGGERRVADAPFVDEVRSELGRRGASFTDGPRRPGAEVRAFGTPVSGLASLLTVVGVLLVLSLLVLGPEPLFATRWAWFWTSAVPGGVFAFLLLSQPLRRVRPPQQRLTGGHAFLLSLVASAVTSAVLATVR